MNKIKPSRYRSLREKIVFEGIFVIFIMHYVHKRKKNSSSYFITIKTSNSTTIYTYIFTH